MAHNERQDIGKSALKILKIREQQEGYWNSERFMNQVAEAVKIAEVKYPPSQGYPHIWCFDHSCGHTGIDRFQDEQGSRWKTAENA